MKPLVPAFFFAALGVAPILPAQTADGLAPPKAEVVEAPESEAVETETVKPAEPAAEEGGADPAALRGETETTPAAESAPSSQGAAGSSTEMRKAEVIPEEEAPVDEDKPEDAKEVRAVPADPKSTAPPTIREMKPDKPRIPMILKTDPNAKLLSLRVPAPRGLIVDRNGKPLAQERIAHFIGVQLPIREGMEDIEVLDFARRPLAFCQSQLQGGWKLSDADILLHYKKRRWVPLMSTALVPDEKVDKLKDQVPPGVSLLPIFLRTYPEGTLAGHLIGQMGKSGGFSPSKNELEVEEPMWPATLGKAGLEKLFDAQLTGKPGLYTALYDSKGEMLTQDWQERPRAGHTVVTTLDVEMQQICERNMQERGVRGAFVIMDVKTGDVVAMASMPGIDPNEWVYGISEKRHQEILNHKENPLYCRALAGLYPPASTFKVVTAFAALETNEVAPNSEFNCLPSLLIDGRSFRNHNSKHMGFMNVERAIAVSCNTWFYQVGKICGGESLSTTASRFGFGGKTGICLSDMEKSGFMPTPESYAKKGSAFSGGHLANAVIGQGEVLATPLQVCQMMAGVARGDSVPRPRLVKMIQDVDGKIVQHFPPAVRNGLNFEKENLDAVRRGLHSVVNGGGGTGSRASNSYVTIVGKTGTGEWGNNKRQYVAWFAGYLPYQNPEYAYACLYEGDPNETSISGGQKVAPIVGDVFNEIYRNKSRRGEVAPDRKDGKDAGDIGDNSEVITPLSKPAEMAPAQAPAPATVAAPEQPKRGLRWLRRRPAKPPAAPAPPSRFGR